MNPLAKPWYREPWPWLLMAGPVAVVLAGIATTVLAVTTFDGLVADDYYKQGLGINRVIARVHPVPDGGKGRSRADGQSGHLNIEVLRGLHIGAPDIHVLQLIDRHRFTPYDGTSRRLMSPNANM